MVRRAILFLLAAVIAGPVAAGSLTLTVLGSGGPGAVGRAGSCHVLQIDGVPRILVDAGPGCFVRLGESGLSSANLDTVLLTHLHADHAGDLPGLVKARAVAVRAPITFKIFGPSGDHRRFPATSRLIDLQFGKTGAFAYLSDFAGHVDFRVTDLPAMTVPKIILSEPGLTVTAISGHHGDAPAIIYRVEHDGHSVTFSGDIDAKGHANLRRLAAGSSLLLFNAVVLDPPQAPVILYSLHTGPTAIGEIARDAGVHGLLLAHLSPATDGNRAEVEAAIRAAYGGPLRFAEDRLTVEP